MKIRWTDKLDGKLPLGVVTGTCCFSGSFRYEPLHAKPGETLEVTSVRPCEEHKGKFDLFLPGPNASTLHPDHIPNVPKSWFEVVEELT